MNFIRTGNQNLIRKTYRTIAWGWKHVSLERRSRIYNSQRDKTFQNSLARPSLPATHIYSLTHVKLDTVGPREKSFFVANFIAHLRNSKIWKSLETPRERTQRRKHSEHQRQGEEENSSPVQQQWNAENFTTSGLYNLQQKDFTPIREFCWNPTYFFKS